MRAVEIGRAPFARAVVGVLHTAVVGEHGVQIGERLREGVGHQQRQPAREALVDAKPGGSCSLELTTDSRC